MCCAQSPEVFGLKVLVQVQKLSRKVKGQKDVGFVLKNVTMFLKN